MDLQPRPDDHEAKMARADLFKLAQYSFKLFKMIHEDQELEGWVQAKITKAADYIASVYHYMEYEMKFSEYGERLENSDVYHQMSESQRIALQNMLTEAKKGMKKLTAAQAKKLKKKDDKVEEGAKPDFADLDDDGDEKEPMKKAAKDAKKVKEGFPTVDSAKKDHEEREKSKGTGKFDKKDTEKGTQYTRKSSTFTDGGDDSDTKAAKKKEKKIKEGGFYNPANDAPVKGSQASQDKLKAAMAASNGQNANAPVKGSQASQDKLKAAMAAANNEGMMDTVKKVGKKVASGINKVVGHGSDEEMRKDLQRKSGAPVTGKKPEQKVKEAAKAKKDYDGDGKIESGKDEYLGSKIRAAKKAGKMEEAAKCNHTAKGKSCPVHGMKECGGSSSMPMEAKPSAGMSKGAKSALVKKAKSGGDIGKPGKSFEKVAAKAGGGEKGKKIAAAAMWKNAAKESVELTPVVVAESAEMSRLKQLNKILNG